jgi:hypothetical protein
LSRAGLIWNEIDVSLKAIDAKQREAQLRLAAEVAR